ncbi:MAG: outer membrane protein assembly factor BamD, partial [Alphaproteobacteria bacterium]|nr:outer membrane protein assembly factor BamD [Alphaproteobacteria bacterium]
RSPPVSVSARPAAPPKPAAPTFDHRQFELAIWESIKQSREATDFEGFLKQYPNSAFAPGARSRIAELKRENRLAMRPPPPSAKPKPPSVSLGEFFSEAEIREAVVGNTLKFPALRNGKHLRKGDDLFIYFAQDGTVAARARTMPRTAQKVWYFNKSAMLCRTTGRNSKNHCVMIAKRDDPDKLELSNPKAGVKYEATILKGRQLPEHASAPTAAAKPNAETTVRLRDRIEALKAEGPHGDCSMQIHESRDRDQAAWAECEDRTDTIAALERRMKQDPAALGTPHSTVAGLGQILSKAEIMETVIGNTVNFRHPAFGSSIFIYFGEDGYAFVKGYHPTKTFRKVWFFNKLGMLCRYKVRPQKICLRVARSDDPSKFELSTPHGVSFDATMLKGRQLPD